MLAFYEVTNGFRKSKEEADELPQKAAGLRGDLYYWRCSSGRLTELIVLLRDMLTLYKVEKPGGFYKVLLHMDGM